jgi:hypothetical protein
LDLDLLRGGMAILIWIPGGLDLDEFLNGSVLEK